MFILTVSVLSLVAECTFQRQKYELYNDDLWLESSSYFSCYTQEETSQRLKYNIYSDSGKPLNKTKIWIFKLEFVLYIILFQEKIASSGNSL